MGRGSWRRIGRSGKGTPWRGERRPCERVGVIEVVSAGHARWGFGLLVGEGAWTRSQKARGGWRLGGDRDCHWGRTRREEPREPLVRWIGKGVGGLACLPASVRWREI